MIFSFIIKFVLRGLFFPDAIEWKPPAKCVTVQQLRKNGTRQFHAESTLLFAAHDK